MSTALEKYQSTLALAKGHGDFMPKSITTQDTGSRVWVVIEVPLEGTLTVSNRLSRTGQVEINSGSKGSIAADALYACGTYDYEYSNLADVGHAVLWHMHYPPK